MAYCELVKLQHIHYSVQIELQCNLNENFIILILYTTYAFEAEYLNGRHSNMFIWNNVYTSKNSCKIFAYIQKKATGSAPE